MSDQPLEMDEATKAKLINAGRAFAAIAANPTHRTAALTLMKAQFPDAVIPEIDAVHAVDARIDSRMKPVLDENAKLVKEVEDLRGIIHRGTFAAEHGLDEDGLEEVEAFAKEYEIRNGAKAVELFRDRQRLGTPRATVRTDSDVEYQKELTKALPRGGAAVRAAVMKHADRVVREVRGGRLR